MNYGRKIFRSMVLPLIPVFTLVSCYEDFTGDYDYSITYFTSQKPLRTVIADRDMKIKVGVSIAGKLAVNQNDWVKFTIDPALMDDFGGGFTLMPAGYYHLADPNTFRVSNKNNPIADVEISFTEAFYNDPAATLHTYAIPFRITECSVDSIHRGKYDVYGNELIPPKDYSVVLIKYISTYHGTYYVHGKVDELNASGEVVNSVVYKNANMTGNIERNVSTLSAKTVLRSGLANLAVADKEGVSLTVGSDANVTLASPAGYLAIFDGSGKYYADRAKPEFELEYKYTKGGKTYKVTETLTLRQDPLLDLRFEEW